MGQDTAIFLIFVMVIVGGIAVIFAALRHRTKVIEMAHRERLAMIERGMTPGVELSGPARVIADLGALHPRGPATSNPRSARLMSAGITVIAIGLGLAMIVGVAGQAPDAAIGLGGAICIVGIAFIATAYLVHGHGRPSAEAEPPARNASERVLPPPPVDPHL